MEQSIIYQSILELKEDNSFKNDIWSYNDYLKWKNASKGFFGSKTLWNMMSPDWEKYLKEDVCKSEINELENDILFVFNSGVIFTKWGIVALSYGGGDFNTSTYVFPFKKRPLDCDYPESLGDYPFKEKFLNKEESKYYYHLIGKENHRVIDDDWYHTYALTVIENTLYILGMELGGLGNEDITNKIIKEDGFKVGGIGVILSENEVRFFKELESLITKKREELFLRRENKYNTELRDSKDNILSKLDKDNNGIVDLVESDDFNKLLKEHQKQIIEIDRNYIQKFVKVSTNLKAKEENIQSIFNSIKNTPNQKLLSEYIKTIELVIHSYNLILFNSLNMIVSLVEDDMITFYEIYESFDNLNMFDSKYERDVSMKLSEIKGEINNLMIELRDVAEKILKSLQALTYETKRSNEILDKRLKGIHSSLRANNLLSLINTYQNYKISKNTKSLR